MKIAKYILVLMLVMSVASAAKFEMRITINSTSDTATMDSCRITPYTPENMLDYKPGNYSVSILDSENHTICSQKFPPFYNVFCPYAIPPIPCNYEERDTATGYFEFCYTEDAKFIAVYRDHDEIFRTGISESLCNRVGFDNEYEDDPNCRQDRGTTICGNKVCEMDENEQSCPQDCTKISGNQSGKPVGEPATTPPAASTINQTTYIAVSVILIVIVALLLTRKK